MQQFLKMASQFIQSEDTIVRDFIAFHLRDFPFTPSEMVNDQLTNALHANNEDKISILIQGNDENVNEDSLPILLELFNKTPKEKRHLITRYARNLPIPVLLDHEEQLKQYISKAYFDICRRCLISDEEDLWKLYADLQHQMEEKGYNGLLFELAKKVQDTLIEKNYYDQQEVRLILQQELTEDWFSFNGILAVRAVGIMQLTEYIETLASLLTRDEDILLEEVEIALSRFQSDEVVRAVAPYAKKFESYHFALGILKHTKTELAEQVLVECYDVLEDDGKEMVLDGLTSHFSKHAFPLIEDFIANKYRGNVLDMEEMFYGFYRVMNRQHPQMEKWRLHVIEQNRRFAQLDDQSFLNLLPKTTPVASVKIGRNDPCHCGSGKKYKKCCGK